MCVFPQTRVSVFSTVVAMTQWNNIIRPEWVKDLAGWLAHLSSSFCCLTAATKVFRKRGELSTLSLVCGQDHSRTSAMLALVLTSSLIFLSKGIFESWASRFFSFSFFWLFSRPLSDSLFAFFLFPLQLPLSHWAWLPANAENSWDRVDFPRVILNYRPWDL